MYQTNERINKGQTKATLTEVASRVLVAALRDLASRVLVDVLVWSSSYRPRHTEIKWFWPRSNPMRCISVPGLFLEYVVILQVSAWVCKK